MKHSAFGSKNLHKKWIKRSLKRIIPIILDICMVKKVKMLTTKLGTVIKS